MTTSEAAAVLGVSPVRIRQLCRAGAFLGAYRRGRDWWIPASVVEARRTRQETRP